MVDDKEQRKITIKLIIDKIGPLAMEFGPKNLGDANCF